MNPLPWDFLYYWTSATEELPLEVEKAVLIGLGWRMMALRRNWVDWGAIKPPTASALCVTCVLFRCFRDFSLWAVEAAATHDIMPIMLHLLFGSFFEDFYYKSWWIMTRTTLPATTEWHIKKCVLFGNYKWILSCDNGNTFRCFLWCTIRRNTQKRENSIKLLQNNGLSSAQTFSQNIYLEIVLHACIKPRNWK